MGLVWSGEPASIEPHPLAPDRRVPMKRLMARLGLTEFRNVGPLEDYGAAPARVMLPFKQHAGAPSVPVVRSGDRVVIGDLVAAPPPGAPGSRIHASIAGVVRSTVDAVVIEA